MGKKEQVPALRSLCRVLCGCGRRLAGVVLPMGGTSTSRLPHGPPRVPAAPNLVVHPPADLSNILLPPVKLLPSSAFQFEQSRPPREGPAASGCPRLLHRWTFHSGQRPLHSGRYGPCSGHSGEARDRLWRSGSRPPISSTHGPLPLQSMNAVLRSDRQVRHRAPPRYTKCACGRTLTDHRSQFQMLREKTALCIAALSRFRPRDDRGVKFGMNFRRPQSTRGAPLSCHATALRGALGLRSMRPQRKSVPRPTHQFRLRRLCRDATTRSTTSCLRPASPSM